jgi:hypothetical protein
MTDLVAEGIAAERRQQWYRVCKVAPVPPLKERSAMAKIPIPTSIKTVCVACGMTADRAAPGHDLCALCVEDVAATRQRLQTMHAGYARQVESAAVMAEQALDALSETERASWTRYQAARLATSRVGRWEGTADPALESKVALMKQILDTAGDTRASDALRRVATLAEYAYYIDAGAETQTRRVDLALAALLDWEEAQS